jgi:hypothetical protein
MLDECAADTDVEDEGATLSELSKDGFGQVKTLKLSAVVGSHR